MTDDFENDLRAMLVDVEQNATPRADLAGRLTTAAVQRGPGTVHRVNPRTRRWLPPLLAAAAVVATVLATAGVISSTHANKQAPATHVPTVSTSPTASPTGLPSPTRSTQPVVPPPVSTVAPGFVAVDVWFRDGQHGYALGNVLCGARLGKCATLLRTDDAGASWQKMAVPGGLTPAGDVGSPPGGSCSDNGTYHGPCVHYVLFPDAQHGYLWSHNQLYMSIDAGQTWTHEIDAVAHKGETYLTDLVAVGNHVIRAGDHSGCMTGCHLHVEFAEIGSHNWTDTTPATAFPVLSRSLIAAGSAVYLYTYAQDATTAVLFRSVDQGATWHALGNTCGDHNGSVGASDGSLFQSCHHPNGNVTVSRIALSATTSGPAHLLPAVAQDSPGVIGPDVQLTAWSSTAISCFVLDTTNPTTNFSQSYGSSDGGTTWKRQVDGSQWTVFGDNSGYRLREDGKGIEVTTDAGNSFITVGF